MATQYVIRSLMTGPIHYLVYIPNLNGPPRYGWSGVLKDAIHKDTMTEAILVAETADCGAYEIVAVNKPDEPEIVAVTKYLVKSTKSGYYLHAARETLGPGLIRVDYSWQPKEHASRFDFMSIAIAEGICATSSTADFEVKCVE